MSIRRTGCRDWPVVMAFICRDISHDRNCYCEGGQTVRLIDTERFRWDFKAPVFQLSKSRIYAKPVFLRLDFDNNGNCKEHKVISLNYRLTLIGLTRL